MTKVREQEAARKRRDRRTLKDVTIRRCANPERRLDLEADTERWLLHYFGTDCGLPDPFWYEFTQQQKEMIAAIENAIRYGGDQALAASRGEGKTTICERVLLKFVLQGVIFFPVLFAATGSAAGNSLESIRVAIEENPILADDYPEVCDPIRALENTPNRAHYQTVSGFRHDTGEAYSQHPSKFSWCGQEVTFPNVPGSPSARAIIATRGLDAAVRGLKKKGRRPDVAVIDDPDTEETVRSEDQAAKLKKRIDEGIAGLGSQQRPIARVMLTTIQNRNCVSWEYTDPEARPSWKGKRFRFLVEPPNHPELWEDYVVERQKDMRSGDSFARRSHRMYLDNFDAMNAGAVVANKHRFNNEILPDGTQAEVTALQRYFNEVARIGQDAVSTEYDNNPPEDEGLERTVLTAYHVQHNARSGLQQHIVPANTVAIAAGVDIKKLGFHYTIWAFAQNAAGCCIDYGFHEINTGDMQMQSVEFAIANGLHEWRETHGDVPYIDIEGNERFMDVAMIDAGWKDESWAGQPVYQFCLESGVNRFLPCKGESPYYPPRAETQTVSGDNWHVSFRRGVPLVLMSSDHWKQKVHEGFLTASGEPGSLLLFEPSASRRQPHMSYAKHITNEVYERRFQPGFKGFKEGWWKIGAQNHYFDATYQALVGCSLMGVSVLAPPQAPPRPTPNPEPAQQTENYSRERW